MGTNLRHRRLCRLARVHVRVLFSCLACFVTHSRYRRRGWAGSAESRDGGGDSYSLSIQSRIYINRERLVCVCVSLYTCVCVCARVCAACAVTTLGSWSQS